MGDLRRMVMLTALAAAGMGGAVVVRADEKLDEQDLLAPIAPEPKPVRLVETAPRQRTVEHKHSREIARRLRQEARRAAKVARAGAPA